MKRAKRLSRPAHPTGSSLEPAIRAVFNEQFGSAAERRMVAVGRKTATHEFALHDPGKILRPTPSTSCNRFSVMPRFAASKRRSSTGSCKAVTRWC